MTDQPDAPNLVLLTREEAGLRLHLAPQAIDGLVKSGELSPARLSRGSEHRFWPDEVLAYELRASISAETATEAHRLASAGAPAASGHPAAGRSSPQPRHPAWPPFVGPVERHVPSYIAFGDRAHLVNYLRRRALIEPA